MISFCNANKTDGASADGCKRGALRPWITALFTLQFLLLISGCAAKNTLGGKESYELFSDRLTVAMVEAASVGDVDKVALLAKQGAQVNAVGRDGMTPLIWVLNTKNYQGVEALLKAGADPNLVTEFDWWPMKLLGGGNEPELLRLLLRYGGDPNHPGKGKVRYRPLTMAASSGYLENTDMLLAAGADINAHDEFHESAAVAAVTMGKYEVTYYLLMHGYNHDLAYLKKAATTRVVAPDSNAQRWKVKVLEFLKAY